MPDGGELAALLASQIAASGPISVAEYMWRANEAYYASGDPFGRDGDFITAPEISQMFGELIGLWMADLWLRADRPAPCHFVELGPGRGTLATDALRAAEGFGFAPPVHFVETSAALRERQRSAVPHAEFYDGIDDLPVDGPMIIIANEFFDALPVRQMVATDEGWREAMVTHRAETGFEIVTGQRDVAALVPDKLRDAPVGSVVEQCPDGAEIMMSLCRRLSKQGGAMLLIDYGYDEPGIGETWQAVKGHQPASVFEQPGTADLTAHVNFHELANIARACSLAIYGPVNQGDLLQGLGIDQRAAALGKHKPEKRIDIAVARDRLISPDEMGSLFKALAVTSPGWPLPEGFGDG